jgi:hypothetical protein
LVLSLVQVEDIFINGFYMAMRGNFSSMTIGAVLGAG